MRQYSIRSLMVAIILAAMLAWLARLSIVHFLVGFAGGCAAAATWFAYRRYAVDGYGFFITTCAGAFGALLATVAVVIVSILLSLLSSLISGTQTNEQYVNVGEAIVLIMIFYGGGSLLGGACVGMSGWLVLRGCRVGERPPNAGR